ncbi:hypothetical protein K2173_015782 [Erythroxylum novogranatense]|uniref:CRAL-TRIO domain-containing protein n=1 Tax=Erythroxylum novogranatense TaxID=1862640 RepID=A0AAV8SEY8_9ROSI|nr:hypothetical protein K2173_015782 [Erythroxylum novogranatense]
MDESLITSGSTRNSKHTAIVNSKKFYRRNLLATGPEGFPQSAYKRITSLSHGINSGGAFGNAALFLLKVAALETVRRVSKSKCPLVWRGIQVLQLLCYPPLKWIQKWVPFKGFIEGVQMFSRPLLVLSIATAFSNEHNFNTETSDLASDSSAHSETHSHSPSVPSTNDERSDEVPRCVASENWLVQLHKELENQGILLPERIDDDELSRFFTAANGDFSYLLSSIKKTIRWRETYRILSEQELKMWTSMVFWHGFDLENRPCLIIRLGQACLDLSSDARPRFAQAVISQVEHGILHLVDKENPQIMVLVDCDGITPLRIPMQMMRSCCTLLQENFPNRLGHLLVIRLPPIVRVIAQTFIQVLKPVTRKKLRIEGSVYHRVLSEYLQQLPSYLGGNCACKICSTTSIHATRHADFREDTMEIDYEHLSDGGDDLSLPNPNYQTDIVMDNEWDQLLRTAVISILMVWIFIALIASFYDPESRPF